MWSLPCRFINIFSAYDEINKLTYFGFYPAGSECVIRPVCVAQCSSVGSICVGEEGGAGRQGSVGGVCFRVCVELCAVCDLIK